ncbi:MAG: DNA mismatch repair protein MutS [Bauldia sp.]
MLNEAPPSDAGKRATPMMEQYFEVKSGYPDCLLFYRLGDFYELFFGDAEIASAALGLALTRRGKHDGVDVPMCGVPVHAADDYLAKLIALGHRVAVCEQTEDPAAAKQRGGKSIVRREVKRLITAGTISEDRLLRPAESNFLCAVARLRADSGADAVYGLAWLDMSTGDFRVSQTIGTDLGAALARIDPREIVVSDALAGFAELGDLWQVWDKRLTRAAASLFEATSAASRLAAGFGAVSLDGFDAYGRAETIAAAAALAYVERTQFGARPALKPPRREESGAVLAIDAATRANLELFRTLSGERQGSLLGAIDRTVSGPGARLLAARLGSPLTDPEAIARRLDTVAFFLDQSMLRRTVREALRRAPDIPRALSRLSLDRAGPRDLAAIRFGLDTAAEIARAFAGASSPADAGSALAALRRAPGKLAATLAAALGESLPLLRRDGGFVQSGWRADLDEARALRDESRRIIAGLQAQYADEADIRGLKIRHNGVLGYFIEVTAAHGDKLLSAPLKERFFHRQTMAGAMRFTTSDLAELEAKIVGAADRALAIELEVFAALQRETLAVAEDLHAVAEGLAAFDVACALATLADDEGYCRPTVDRSLAFAVTGGRHPVVEQALRRADVESRPAGAAPGFVANDCDLGPPAGADAGRIWLLTGPNMAGKSTFLRQNALIAILAQTGSFVPATSAHVGVVDRLFSRVGAADDLARGRSTFMVEMVETAAILNRAGERSLVILDEIGRGTSTFDGLSIAWAAIEHLHQVNRCRTLFATHYHELTALAARLPRLANVTVQVKEWQGDVVFLHTIAPGAADRSYGIQVAKLAGLPRSAIARAGEVLRQLEAHDRRSPAAVVDELPLFAALREAKTEPAPDRLAEALDGIDPDALTPREALEKLYALKKLRKG